MVDHRINPIEVNWDPNLRVSIREVNKDLNTKIKPMLLPEANKPALFFLGDSNMLILMKGSTGDILLPHSHLLDLITQWLVMLLVGLSFS